jgi:hypothetical protein
MPYDIESSRRLTEEVTRQLSVKLSGTYNVARHRQP